MLRKTQLHTFAALGYAVALAAAISGCQTTGPGSSYNWGALSSGVAKVESKADAVVAQSAKALADNCALLSAAVDVAYVFATSAKVRNGLNIADKALTSYCSGPVPQDIPQALSAVAAAYRSVKEATPSNGSAI